MRYFSVLFIFAAGLLLAAPLSGQPVLDVILITAGTSSSPSGLTLADWLDDTPPERVASVQLASGGPLSTTVGNLPKLVKALAVGNYQCIVYKEEEAIQATLKVE